MGEVLLVMDRIDRKTGVMKLTMMRVVMVATTRKRIEYGVLLDIMLKRRMRTTLVMRAMFLTSRRIWVLPMIGDDDVGYNDDDS